MTEKEAAAYLGIGYRTLMRLRRRGVVPYRRLPGVRRVIYDKDALVQWRDERAPMQGGAAITAPQGCPASDILERFGC